ncbi:MAG: IS256 family transposase [Acidimicrobiia bacterium]|nr:IS256 family transposase [Acidimicrobiia bacterium]
MLEPDAWKAGTSGSEGAPAQQRAGATRLIGLLSRGMTTRDIQAHIAEIYQVDISPELVSKITDAVLPELREWQQRPLDVMYPILYLDAIVVKVRTDGQVRNRPVYIALGVDLDGRKHVLGLWLGSGDEGAKYWLSVLTELKNRGVKDVLIACCDGLTGFGDAIEAVWPQATVQTCVVHLIRNTIRFISWNDRKAISRDLKPVYRAATPEAARQALDDFEDEWGNKYPAVVDLCVATELGEVHPLLGV